MDDNNLPSLIINPNSTPSRMAISQLFEISMQRLSDEEWDKLNNEQKIDLISIFKNSASFR